jgi:hypothetical protein
MLFVHVMLTGKGLLVSKRVMSIQLSKNYVLQGVVLNVLIYPIIARKKNTSKNKKPKATQDCKHKKTQLLHLLCIAFGIVMA